MLHRCQFKVNMNEDWEFFLHEGGIGSSQASANQNFENDDMYILDLTQQPSSDSLISVGQGAWKQS